MSYHKRRSDSQLTLDHLRQLVAKGPKEESDASTAVSAPRNQKPTFQTAAVLAGFTSTPSKKNRRRSSPLHASPTPTVPPPVLAAGGGGLLEEKAAENDELHQFDSIINGEVTGDHVRQILSMRFQDSVKIKESDIGGLEEVKKLIRRKVIAPLKRPDLHVGLYEAARGVLFFGPPGTGKTTLAKWIASETQASFLNVTASSLISKFQGETETLVKTLFLVAGCLQPCIIFLDEIDALIGKRKEKEEDSTLRMKNQLLQAMDGMTSSHTTVIVIGATNRPDAVDMAALRRLPKRIYIPLPDLDARVQQLTKILRNHARDLGHPWQTTDDLVTVARSLEGFNGSDLIALCTTAAELVYEKTISRLGLENLKGPQDFNVPTARDLEKARETVHPSGAANSEVDYAEWSARLGCL